MSPQYGELLRTITAEIASGVLGTPANFNGFRDLAALLHGTLYDMMDYINVRPKADV